MRRENRVEDVRKDKLGVFKRRLGKSEGNNVL